MAAELGTFIINVKSLADNRPLAARLKENQWLNLDHS
jgi:hypothetical protein